MSEVLLPTVNADGLPVVPMSAAQKYLFDLKGWICLPGLLSEAQLGPVRAHQMKFLYERDSLPPEERDNHGGPSQILLDHPAVVGVLNAVLSHQPLATEDCYGFRPGRMKVTGALRQRPGAGGGEVAGSAVIEDPSA